MNAKSRRAVIDIGSNTIRLVVFGGAARAPVVLYNEKLTAGLGKGVLASGLLSAKSMHAACDGLARFKVLIDAMGVASLRVVATAAVRDAANRRQFLDMVRDLGLPAELLDGEAEATAAGYGVICAMPEADGLVVDLGGGSLELVRVTRGRVEDRVSLPLGIFAVAGLRGEKPGKLGRHIQELIADIPWIWRTNDLPLYLVGGSWRSLARAHIHITEFPLPVLNNYRIAPTQVQPFADAVRAMDKAQLAAIPSMPAGRVPLIADAAALLLALVEVISPGALVVSSFGLREGLLYQDLNEHERAEDPLIAGVRFASGQYDQFPGHAEALVRWLDGLFADEEPGVSRLRSAVCHMFGTGWASSPDFRAVSGEELALHGNWIGIDAADRAKMGMALFVGLGGAGSPPPILAGLAGAEGLLRARCWGLALRLAQRLSGGAARILDRSRLIVAERRLQLHLPGELSRLGDDSLIRRLDRLAAAVSALRGEAIAPELVIAR